MRDARISRIAYSGEPVGWEMHIYTGERRPGDYDGVGPRTVASIGPTANSPVDLGRPGH